MGVLSASRLVSPATRVPLSSVPEGTTSPPPLGPGVRPRETTEGSSPSSGCCFRIFLEWLTTHLKKSMYLFRLCWVTAAACGLSLTAVHGLLLAVAPVLQSMSSGECCSAAVTRRFSGCSSQALEHGLSSYGTWALLSCSMGDPPGSGIELVSPASAGRFLTTGSPGKPDHPL